VQFSPWDVVATIVKAITYAATLGAAGAVFFLFYCRAYIREPIHRRIRRLIGLLVLLTICCSLARIPLLAASMSDGATGMLDPNLYLMIWHSGEGRASAIRVVAVLFAGSAALSRSPGGAIPIIGAGIAATSFAWTGHAQALHPSWAPVTLIGMHLLGVAFWLGALPALLLVSRDPDHSYIATSAQRFGELAVLVVITMVIAGACVLWSLLGDISALWSSAYGRIFSLKIGMVSLLLAAAAFNKLRLTPRLGAKDTLALSRLRRSIMFEMAAAAAILLISATFTTLLGPPALQ
jgi:copper resistance protein D